MIKKVLIVDDDREMVLSLKEGLEKYDETFSVLMAGDGLIAMEKLKKLPVSLVVTDLKMPSTNTIMPSLSKTALAVMVHHICVPPSFLKGKQRSSA